MKQTSRIVVRTIKRRNYLPELSIGAVILALGMMIVLASNGTI
jgi:hypothetical protein